MKLNTIIRILAGLSFLIFFCPFFQMCSDEDLKSSFLKENTSKETVSNNDISQDSIPLQKGKFSITSTIDTIIVYDTKPVEKIDFRRENILRKNRKEWTFNAYKLGTYVFSNPESFKWIDLTEVVYWIFIGFPFILLLSVALIITSFVKRWLVVRNLATVNLVLALLFIATSYLGNTLEDLAQIKYGYYLFLVNTIAIITLSQKEMQRQKETTQAGNIK